MDWFNEAKLGIFIHWGLYAIPAYDNVECAKVRNIGNGSEWYYERLMKDKRCNISDNLTQAYHKKKYKEMEYEKFLTMFKGKNFNADQLVSKIKTTGAKYIVFTAKHHDGFCLWETKTTHYNVMNSPLKKDVLKELLLASRKYNIKFGIYYSWMEFGQSLNIKYKQEKMIPQLKELLGYKPDLFWMDGDWIGSQEDLNSIDFVKAVHKLGAIINSRLGRNNIGGDYENYMDRFIPIEKMERKYESCHTIGYSWGYNKQQKKEDYKTSDELLEIYHKVNNTNGNLLLNISLDEHGNFDRIEEERLIEFAKKIKP